VNNHRRALVTITAAVALDTALGLSFGAADHIGPANGLYFATTTATTVGYGDITPQGWLPHVLAVAIMVTVIPLFAATFSLLTSGLTAGHVTASEHRVKAHIERRFREHLGEPPGGEGGGT
jgi:voltage-gated potassium channel